jgi:hypothetical protein
MKKFSEMNQSEINALSKEEFKLVSPFEKKSCYDCGHLKNTLSWWCTSEDARKARGTTLPGCIKCTFWNPNWKVIDDKYKTEENGYVKSIEKVKQQFKKIESVLSKQYIKLSFGIKGFLLWQNI